MSPTDIVTILQLLLALLFIYVLPYFPLVSHAFSNKRWEARLLGATCLSFVPSLTISFFLIGTALYSPAVFLIIHYLTAVSASWLYARYAGLSFLGLMRRCVDRGPREATSYLDTIIFLVALVVGGVIRMRHAVVSSSIGLSDPWAHMLMTKNLLNGAFFDPLHYGTYPRGMHSIYMVISTTTGVSLFHTIKFLGPLFGTLTIIALYAAVRHLFGRFAGLFSAVIYTVTPFSLLIPPLPVLYSSILKRQSISIPENIGLILLSVFIIWTYDFFSKNKLDKKHLAYLVLLSYALALIHPVTALYTFGTLFLMFLVYSDKWHSSPLRGVVSFILIILSNIFVRIYFFVTQDVIKAPSMAATEDIDVAGRTVETVQYIPFFNINPYYIFVLIAGSALLAYGLHKRRRAHAWYGLAVISLLFISVTGMLRLYSSAFRSFYYLSFFTSGLWAVAFWALLEVPGKLRLAVIPGPASQLKKRLTDIIDRLTGGIGILPLVLLVYFPTCSVFTFLAWQFELEISMTIAALLAVLAAVIALAIVSKRDRSLFLFLIVVLAVIVLCIEALMLGGDPGLSGSILSTGALVAVFIFYRSSHFERYAEIFLVSPVFLFLVLYYIPYSLHQYTLAPLVFLVSVVFIKVSYGKTKSKNRRRSIAYPMALVGIYVVLRACILIWAVDPWLVGGVILLAALPLLLKDQLQETSPWVNQQWFPLVLTAAFAAAYPVLFSLPYHFTFLYGVPIAFANLVFGYHNLSVKSKDTFPNLFTVLLSLTFFTIMVLTYPPLNELLSAVTALWSHTRFVQMLPELAALFLLLFATAYNVMRRHQNFSSSLSKKPPSRGRRTASAAENKSPLLKFAALISLALIFIPSCSGHLYIETRDFQDWPDAYRAIARDFDPGNTAVYTETQPEWMAMAFLYPDYEIYDLPELLYIPPHAYIPHDKNTYSGLEGRYFDPRSFTRTTETFRWIEEYEEIYGPDSITVYYETENIVIYHLVRNYDLPTDDA